MTRFGVRLARVTRVIVGAESAWIVPVGWKWLRWVWPLTGWWSDYRWIARRR